MTHWRLGPIAVSVIAFLEAAGEVSVRGGGLGAPVVLYDQVVSAVQDGSVMCPVRYFSGTRSYADR